MAEALLSGLLGSTRADPSLVFVTDVSRERRDLMARRFGVRIGGDNREAVSWADIVLLAVKPQVMDAVLADVGPLLSDRLVISIAAGVPIQRLVKQMPVDARVIRVMPNAPALVREGMSVLTFGPGVTDEDRRSVQMLFRVVGQVAAVEEPLMEAVTGLSGSGPAYVFMAIEALADGGVKMGLPRSVAELLAAQTALGAARMFLAAGEHSKRLKCYVAYSDGVTSAGLNQLDGGAFRAGVIAAVEAATRRAEELGRTTSDAGGADKCF